MELTRENSAIARRNRTVGLGLCAHSGELLFGHDQKILVARFGQDDEILAFSATPAGWNRDSVFLVDGMTKLAGEKFLGLRVGVHARANCSILIHFPPLLTTSRTKVSIKNKSVFLGFLPKLRLSQNPLPLATTTKDG